MFPIQVALVDVTFFLFLALVVAQSAEALLVGNLAGPDLTLAAVGLAALGYYYLVGREERIDADATGSEDRPAR